MGRLLISLIIIACAPLACLSDAAQARGSFGGRIIVSGASGALGSLTVKALLARGVAPSDLILVSRSTGDLQQYAKMGASVRYADLFKPETLADAYAGGTRMLLISIAPGPGTSRPDAQKAAFDAAVKDGVKHIVYTSFPNLEHNHSALGVDHALTERHLKASGAHWTMLRNNGFAEIAVAGATKMYASGRVEIPANDSAVAYITHADLATAAAAALLTAGEKDRTFEVTGTDMFDMRALARLVEKVTGKPIQTIDVPAIQDEKVFPQGMNIVSHDFRKLTGREPEKLSFVLEENKDLIFSGTPTDYTGRPISLGKTPAP